MLSTTKKTNQNPLLSIEPTNQGMANEITHVAIQDLYNSLRERGIIPPVDAMECTDHPEAITEDNKLIVKKIISIAEAVPQP